MIRWPNGSGAAPRCSRTGEWLEYLKQSPDIVTHMESRILVPAPFSPLR